MPKRSYSSRTSCLTTATYFTVSGSSISFIGKDVVVGAREVAVELMMSPSFAVFMGFLGGLQGGGRCTPGGSLSGGSVRQCKPPMAVSIVISVAAMIVEGR